MTKVKKDRYGLRGEVHFQMAPLIDVVFLLLIFFICVTTFHQTEKVDVLLAYAQMAEEFKEDDTTLLVNVTKFGEIIVTGETEGRVTFLHRDPLQEFMQGLVDKAGGPGFRVAIRADAKAKMKQVKEVYRAAARVGLTRISLVTQTRKQEMAGEPDAALSEEEEEEYEEGLIY